MTGCQGKFVVMRRTDEYDNTVPTTGLVDLGDLEIYHICESPVWDPQAYAEQPTVVLEAFFSGHRTTCCPRLRQVQVGDVVRTPAGTFWLVETTGWLEVSPAAVQEALRPSVRQETGS